MALSRHVLRAPRLLNQCQRVAFAGQQKCNASGTGTELMLTFTTPGEVFYKGVEVRQVDISTQAGSFGIVAQHVPTIGTLKPGIMDVFQLDGTVKKFFVGGGAVTVNKDSSVQILAEEAQPLDRFDREAVTRQLEQARQSVSQASTEKERAEAMIAVECMEALSSAV